jgi:serine/threonine protein kinase
MLPVRHPHLVRVLEFGVTGPHHWLAMEYVAGESLVQVIGRVGVAGMLDWRFAYRVGVHITRALCFVHQRHIVHRNLTPRNVLVRASDKCALLGDLVLAKTVEEDSSPLTRPGELVGDVHYMSPERIHGGPLVDARSDIYSLGALLYALLTGRPPLASTSLADTIALILQATPESPRKRQLAISEMFEGVVMKMLAKRPDERFQTAGELLQQLNRVGTFQGVTVE